MPFNNFDTIDCPQKFCSEFIILLYLCIHFTFHAIFHFFLHSIASLEMYHYLMQRSSNKKQHSFSLMPLSVSFTRRLCLCLCMCVLTTVNKGTFHFNQQLNNAQINKSFCDSYSISFHGRHNGNHGICLV